MKAVSVLLKKLQEFWFKWRMARLTKNRLAAPPPPITQLDELLAFAETIASSVERINYRFFDAVNEGLISADDTMFKNIIQLRFSADRLKDELLIRVQKQ